MYIKELTGSLHLFLYYNYIIYLYLIYLVAERATLSCKRKTPVYKILTHSFFLQSIHFSYCLSDHYVKKQLFHPAKVLQICLHYTEANYELPIPALLSISIELNSKYLISVLKQHQIKLINIILLINDCLLYNQIHLTAWTKRPVRPRQQILCLFQI